MKTLNKVKMSIWINALSAIAIGILFLINPQESFEVITIIAGIIITATGIVDFIYYLNGWLDIYFMKNTLLSGFLKCILGIFVLSHIPLMTTFLLYIFSLYIIISALYCLEAYTFMKSMITSSITFDYIHCNYFNFHRTCDVLLSTKYSDFIIFCHWHFVPC